MKLSDEELNRMLDTSSPVAVEQDEVVRTAVRNRVASIAVPARRRKTLVIGSIVGGLLVAGTTAAALPSIFEGFGRIDYQSSQQYTVDGRGPFLCQFAFRVEPVGEGIPLEPTDGTPAPGYDEVHEFVMTHDWNFDDEPRDLVGRDDGTRTAALGVMSDFISASWQAELDSAYPGWMSSVGEVASAGSCVDVADGSAP